MEPNRARARELATAYLAKGDPTGWFEQLYREAEAGQSTVPWADLQPNPNLLSFWKQHAIQTEGKAALKIGCGLGDDAEQLAAWGFDVMAFDISEAAIRGCRKRFPHSSVRYVVADLLQLPEEWTGRFDFVQESYTLQVLPPELRRRAIDNAAAMVSPEGRLLVIARGRDESEPVGQMPWPLTLRELDQITQAGLQELFREDYFDEEQPPVRRFRALYQRPAA